MDRIDDRTREMENAETIKNRTREKIRDLKQRKKEINDELASHPPPNPETLVRIEDLNRACSELQNEVGFDFLDQKDSFFAGLFDSI